MSVNNLTSLSFGKYRLLAELGQGGMAEVFLAVARGPVGFSKLQVIKVLRSHLVEDPDFLTMFLDEARLAAHLNHPNIVQTNEVGDQEGRYFIAMEYLDGQSLDQVLRRLKPNRLPLPMYLRVLSEALVGLHYAHESASFDGTPLDIVHRDVTPHNVFVTYDGVVKLVDFGIAKAASCKAETEAGVLKGKITYMAPEQARGEPVDRRSDLFAVGIMLWEALSGKKPWQGMTEVQILNRLANGDIPSIREAAPGAPEELVVTCEQLLSASAAARCATAAEVHARLESYLKTLPEAPLSRDVGAFVADLFKDRRAQMRAVLEAQLQNVQSSPIEGPPASLTLTTTGPSAPSSPSANRIPRLGATPSSDDADDLPPPSRSAASLTAATTVPNVRPGSSSRVAAVVVSLVLGVSGVLWLLRPAPSPPGPASPGATATVSVPAAASSPQDQAVSVDVSIDATPPEAKLFLDDAPLPSNPFTGRFARDGLVHRIRAEAPGYVTKLEIVRFGEAITQHVTLERVADPKAARPDAKPATTTTTGRSKPKIDKEDPWSK